ncbi:MAG: alanine racemase, partial [Rhizobiales bacterium]|nr:alanine racemase [Hyphomicrobiales bacterium]
MATNPSDRGPAPITGARLTIDLDALAANWALLDRHAAGAETAAAVKADAYGLGIEPVVRALAAAGCRTFFIALPEEGIRVRRVARGATIYVLAGLIEGSADTLVAHDLRPVLNSPAEIEEWAAHRRRGAPTGSAIHIDTGMNRLGLSLHEALELSRDAALLAAVAPSLIMSHLACSDTPGHPQNVRQLALFREIRAEFPGIPASLANSAGVFLGEDYRFDLVRPGIALYGVAPVAGVENPMRTVVTAEARILAIREAEAGETVGYGATETLKRASRLAILSAGYADGYHRSAGSSDQHHGAYVMIRGARAPLAGRVSMDLTAVDVTDLRLAARGDWAELFGRNVPIESVAHAAGTIGYEFLTCLGRRYARTYRRG